MKKKKEKRRKLCGAPRSFKLWLQSGVAWPLSGLIDKQPQRDSCDVGLSPRSTIPPTLERDHGIASFLLARLALPAQATPLSSMANPIQTLPKFLLPRLSWTAPVGQTFARRSIVSGQTNNQRAWQPPAPTIHGATAPFRGSPDRSSRRAPSVLQQPALRRAFHASAPRRREHHFDTLKFVQRLQSEGFTEEQSVAMMKVLNDVIQERSALSSSSPAPYEKTPS